MQFKGRGKALAQISMLNNRHMMEIGVTWLLEEGDKSELTLGHFFN